jgi:hypothetical protein
VKAVEHSRRESTWAGYPLFVVIVVIMVCSAMCACLVALAILVSVVVLVVGVLESMIFMRGLWWEVAWPPCWGWG